MTRAHKLANLIELRIPRTAALGAREWPGARKGGSALFERRHGQAGTVETDPVALGILTAPAPDDRAAVVVDAIGQTVALRERDTGEMRGQGFSDMIEGVVVIVEHHNTPLPTETAARWAGARRGSSTVSDIGAQEYRQIVRYQRQRAAWHDVCRPCSQDSRLSQ